MRPIEVYFDGACGPVNPGGHAGYGWIIYDPDGQTIDKGFGYIGQGNGMTNNVAEASGLIVVLEKLFELGLADRFIRVNGDSLIVINRMSKKSTSIPKGIYVPYITKALVLKQLFTDIHFHWIPRVKNTVADRLSKESIISHEGLEPEVEL